MPNTALYQRHILSDIARLDERKHRFTSLRQQFLVKHCAPIQANIDSLLLQIEQLRLVADSQTQFVEEQP